MILFLHLIIILYEARVRCISAEFSSENVPPIAYRDGEVRVQPQANIQLPLESSMAAPNDGLNDGAPPPSTNEA